MNNQNLPIEAPQQSTGSIFLQWAIGITLVVAGFQIGYYTDTDKDDDGVPDKIEMKCHLNPYSTDSDSNGVKDGDEIFTCFLGSPASASNAAMTDSICLTTLGDAKKICFHPADILLFESTQGNKLMFDWHGDAEYVRENLKEIDRLLQQTGYSYFLKVSRQDLANLMLAECYDVKNQKLYLSIDENIWCPVTTKDMPKVLEGQVRPCDEEN